MSFAAALRRARERAGFNQSDLARRVGGCAAMINHLESGRREPSLKNLRKLVVALAISADELLELAPSRPASLPADHIH